MREQLNDDNMAPKGVKSFSLQKKWEKKKTKNENKQKTPTPNHPFKFWKENSSQWNTAVKICSLSTKKMWWSTGQFYKTVFKTSAYIPIPTATVHFSFKNIGTTFIKQTKNCWYFESIQVRQWTIVKYMDKLLNIHLAPILFQTHFHKIVMNTM